MPSFLGMSTGAADPAALIRSAVPARSAGAPTSMASIIVFAFSGMETDASLQLRELRFALALCLAQMNLRGVQTTGYFVCGFSATCKALHTDEGF